MLKNALRTVCVSLLTGSLLQVSGALAQDDPGGADAATIELRIEAVEASTSLEDQVAARLVDLYRRALVNLDRERLESEAAEQYERTGRDASAMLVDVQSEIEALWWIEWKRHRKGTRCWMR